MPLSPLLSGYDHVILDLDGCVWVGDTVTPRAPEAIVSVSSSNAVWTAAERAFWSSPRKFAFFSHTNFSP